MKKLAIKILLLILPFFIAYLYIEHQLSLIPNSHSQKKKFLEAQLNKIQVLQLGGSHAYFGVDPEYFSYYGFNLANVSQTLYYDSRLAAKYIDKMPSLKLIIVLISYESFRDQLRNSTEYWREYYYYKDWNIDDPNLSYIEPARYSNIFLYGIDEVKRFSKKDFKMNLAEHLQYNGYEKLDSTHQKDNISDKMGKERLLFLGNEMKEKYVYDNYNDVEKLLEIAHAHHVQVVFMTAPVYATYYKYTDPVVVSENDSLVHKLCGLYGSKYFNYFTDGRFNISDFEDNDHLSYVGAAKLSKIMDSEIIRPMMGK